jgi:hypothetical protein
MAFSTGILTSISPVEDVCYALWMLGQDHGVVHMRETAMIGTSFDLVAARSAFKGL